MRAKGQRNSTDSTLTRQQVEVISALVRGESVTDATRAANVDRTTYYLWRQESCFVAELNRAKRESVDAMRGELRGLSNLAAVAIREILTGTEIPPGVRLKAAMAVLAATGSLEPEVIGPGTPGGVRFEWLTEPESSFS